MKENYVKLINACLPQKLIEALEVKSGLERKQVESICLEVVARIFGDGSDLTKVTVLTKLKNIVSGEELKKIIERLSTKYSINPQSATVVLGQLLPLLFQRIQGLDDSYFDRSEPIKEEVKKPQETSVDDVYKNIERKAEAQVNKKTKTKKEKKPLFKKKEKLKKDEVMGPIDDRELSIIEKICIWAIVLALLALIGVVVFLFIKQAA